MNPTVIEIPFTLGTIVAETGTNMVRGQDLFQVGNTYRLEQGAPAISFQAWVQRVDVREYVAYLESKGETAIIRRKGKFGGSWLCMKLAIDAAMALSPQFKDEVLEIFLTHKVLTMRDEGGELFKDMNTALEMAAESVLGKPAHKGHYITLATTIKKRLGVEDWNTCPPDRRYLRAQLEDRLATMLKAGVVRDWDHLKELAKTV